MSIVTGTFEIECKNCGTIHAFEPEDTDFENTFGEPDRQMGTENGYSWEHSFECDGDEETTCGNEIEIDYQVSEYPLGAFNHDIVNVKGAIVNEKFSYNFHEEPEQDED